MEGIAPPVAMGGVTRKATVGVVGDTDRIQGVASSVSDERLLFDTVSAEEAVSRAEAGGVDCVAAVSFGGALALLERVREVDAEVPFVVFSDGSLGEDEALEAGVTEHVGLPVEGERGVGRRLLRYAEGHRSGRAERKLDSFLRHTPDQIWIHDAEGEILDVNRQACEALGYGRDEIVGKSVWDIEVGTDRDELDEIWSGYEYGDSVVVEGRHRRKDGAEFPVEVNIGKVLVEGEERFLAIIRDTTRRETVEKSLRRLRKEHETVFENVQDPVFFVSVGDDGGGGGDDGGRFVFKRLNPAYEEQVGVTEKEVRGRTPREVFGEGVGAELAANYGRCVEEGETLSYDETIEVPAGTRTYHTKIAPVFSDGEVTAIVGSARDITERKERERELERYEAYIENTSDIITHLGADGTVLYQSPSIERVLGVDRDDWVGDNVFDHVHPDDSARVAQEFMSLVEEPERAVEDVEFRMESAEGGYVWIESVGTDWRGSELGGVVVSSRDVTERRRREEALERSRDLLRHTEEVADTGGWEIDAENNEIRWTDGTRRIHGVEEGYEPSVEDAVRFYHPDDRERVREVIEGFDEVGEAFDEELRILTRDRGERWVRTRGETVSENGDVVLRGAIQDITERKERERSLEEQKELLEERKEGIQFFNSLLRHEMLNSMTVIRGNAEMLLESLPEDDKRRESAEKIHRRADEIVDLTNRVRSVLRRITREDTPELTPVDLAETARERAESAQEVYDAEVAAFTPDETYVEADEFLGDVVDNLLINAIEHNDKEKPRAEVTVERGDGCVILSVADNGPGIPDEMKETVFGQGEKGSASGGIGFGLYFVDSMVSEYGGNVRVEDSQLKGAVVIVELPAAVPEGKG